MSKGFRQSQAFLHTWTGLLAGWIVFLVFTAGTIAFWREGLNRWMRPELPRIESPTRVLAGAQAFLAHSAPDATGWTIIVPTRTMPGAQVYWSPRFGDGPRPDWRSTQALIGADGQPAHARATMGGEFFYRFHFDLHYMPILWARWLVGAAALAMLVALCTGIVTHKKIFRDFFTLRRGKGQRSWLDGHNAAGVLALPFHLMMTYTGLVTLMAMLMPWAVVANYADPAAMAAASYPAPPAPVRTGRAAPLVDLTRIAADAERRLGAPAGLIEVGEPGDAAARITVSQSAGSMLSAHTPRLAYDGVSGRLVWAAPSPGPAMETAGAMVGLHAGRFAGPGLRWLYFLGGIGGTLMVASGLVLWTVKRRDKLPDPARPHFGFRLVERLNVTVIGGFPFGIACFFAANRLLPVAMAGREDAEIAMLFAGWAAAGAAAVGLGPARVWPRLLAATGCVLLGVVAYDQIATSYDMVTTLSDGDATIAGIEATVFITGIAFLLIARRVARHRPAVRPTRPRTLLTEPAA